MRRRRARPPHVLEVGVRWPPETFVAWMLEGLAANGWRVTVASRQIVDPDAKLRGVDLVEIPRRPRTKWEAARIIARHGVPLLLTAPRRLVKLLRSTGRATPGTRRRAGGGVGLLAVSLPLARFRPDVVKFEWNTAAADYLPLYDVWGCPVLTSCRGSDTSVYPHIPALDYHATHLPRVLEKVSAAHCVSASIMREAVGFGLDPAKARVIRPGVDPELFRPADGSPASNGARPGGALRVLMVGWLRWEKGYEYALEAIRELSDRGIVARLDIVGSVPFERRGPSTERERIVHTVTELGLEQHVRLLGRLSSAEIVDRLRASDVFLHPSVTEGLPLAIVEAMACGLPIVASDCGGVSEAVTEGVEGLLVPPRDSACLADALERLARDPGIGRRMGAAGRARVMSEFTLEDEHGAFMDMFREVIAA
jgi:colanic acid/amylovoran biosynthesis glycosyltransferase